MSFFNYQELWNRYIFITNNNAYVILRIATLIIKGRLQIHSLFGYDPDNRVLPKLQNETDSILSQSEVLQRTLADFSGELPSHYLAGKKIGTVLEELFKFFPSFTFLLFQM